MEEVSLHPMIFNNCYQWMGTNKTLPWTTVEIPREEYLPEEAPCSDLHKFATLTRSDFMSRG